MTYVRFKAEFKSFLEYFWLCLFCIKKYLICFVKLFWFLISMCPRTFKIFNNFWCEDINYMKLARYHNLFFFITVEPFKKIFRTINAIFPNLFSLFTFDKMQGFLDIGFFIIIVLNLKNNFWQSIYYFIMWLQNIQNFDIKSL